MHALHEEDQVIADSQKEEQGPEPLTGAASLDELEGLSREGALPQHLMGAASLHDEQGLSREGALRSLPALAVPQVEDVTPQSPPPQPKDEPPCFVE
eukprot:4935153-Amphidinium_carterae.1